MSYQRLELPNTGGVTISTANGNLDGTGTMGTVITSANDGTIIEKIIVKATGSTTEGMVRLFVGSGGTKRLYREISIPELTQTGVEPAFQVKLDEDLVLDSGEELYAATQWSETFNVIAVATEWTNCDCVTNCPVTVEYELNNGLVNINTANANLDGSGTMGSVIGASLGANRGTRIPKAKIKATGSTSEGMIRFFLDFGGGGTKMLYWEMRVIGTTQTNVVAAYEISAILDLYLSPGDILYAATENAESFNIIAEASDHIYCACPA